MLRPSSPIVLALDIGSSSARALIFDARGIAIPHANAQIAYTVQTTADGGAMLDADALLVSVEQCIDAVLPHCGANGVQAVGCATLVGNLLGVDAAGRAITPLWTWADTRSASAARLLRQQSNEPAIWQRTGCPIHSAYWPARMRWLAAEQPDLFARVQRWLTFGEYLTERWLGRPLLSPSVVAWNGMFNRVSQTWDAEWLAELPLRVDQLSPISAARTPHRGLAPTYTTRWPALRDAAWLPPMGDGIGSNWGVGATNPARVAINIGTSGAMRVVLPAGGTLPAGLWAYRIDAQHELVGGALSNGGNLVRWASDTFNLPDLAQLDAALLPLPAAAHGLSVLPFWAGERSPNYDPNARATIHGLSLHTTPLQIVQAMLEAVAYSFGAIYERLRPVLAADHTLVAGGGALENSPLWAQILCDVLGMPLHRGTTDQATARGIALFALESLGILVETPSSAATVLTPSLVNHERYRQARAESDDLRRRVMRNQESGIRNE